jgi:hypothetical protein
MDFLITAAGVAPFLLMAGSAYPGNRVPQRVPVKPPVHSQQSTLYGRAPL